MSNSLPPYSFGPNQEALLDCVTGHISRELAEPGRHKRTGERVMAALMGDVNGLAAIPPETVSEIEVVRHELFMGCVALFSMADTVRSAEYYFRRYRFSGLPVTKADHLRNSCEMYFDRIVQFRDRLKTTLTALKKYQPSYDLKIGSIVKVYDKAFYWEIRQRNRVHHKGRYEDQFIDQLSLIQTLEIGMPEINKFLNAKGIHRTAVNLWVKKVRNGARSLDLFLEQVSAIILAGLPPADKVTSKNKNT